jgi:predicted nucleic acid-binding protein
VDKKLDLVYSFVSRFENSMSPFALNKNTVNNFFSHAVSYIDRAYAGAVDKRAKEIMNTGVKTRDAYHIACAIEGGCAYFITCDKPLLRYKSAEIIVCDPIQFVDIWEELNHG